MSWNQPQGGGATPPPAPGEAGPDGIKPTNTTEDLHALAVDIQTQLQTLATGLAHAGAAPPAVASLTHMAGVISQVVKVLGSPEAQQSQPASRPQGPSQPMAQSPAAESSQPTQGRPQAPHAALGAAVSALHEGMQAQAQRRASGMA